MHIIALYVGGRRLRARGLRRRSCPAPTRPWPTLERYKSRLDEVTGTLSALEIEDLVTVRDVANVLQRLEMVRRIARRDRRATSSSSAPTAGCSRLQLEELIGGVDADRELVIRDYLPEAKAGYSLEEALADLEALDSTELLDLGRRRPGARLHHRRRRARRRGQPARLPAARPRCRACPAPIVDRLVDALRQPAEAARRQHRRPAGRRGRRRGPGPRRPRGPVPPGRVEHPRALRLTRAACRVLPPLACTSGCSTGTPSTPAPLPWRDAVVLARGGCWSPRSCRTRPRWPGSSRCGASGCSAGRPRPTSRPSRPARSCGPGAGWATRAGRCGCARRPSPSSSGTAATVPDDEDAAARAAGGRRLHRGGGGGLRVRPAHHRGRHQRAAGARPRRRGQRPRGTRADRRRVGAGRLARARGPGHVGDLERRRDGARGPGLPGPRRRGATSARWPTCCAWVAAGRPAHDGPAAPGPGVARHRPAGARRHAPAAARQPGPGGAGRAARPPGPTPARSTGASPRSSRTACSSRTAAGATASRA